MERKRELTKILLAESFKELLIKGSFDKITIKMITDQAGVIRPTFYNYFQDKYEVMEWLLETEVFQHIREMTEDGMEREAIYLLFRKMEKDRIYYQKAFEATGQNGFEEILEKKIRQLIEEMVGRHKIKLEKLQGIKDKKIFLEFHTITAVTAFFRAISGKKDAVSIIISSSVMHRVRGIFRRKNTESRLMKYSNSWEEIMIKS